MKKKLLTFILMITAMFTGVVGLTACEKEPTPPQGPAQSSNDMGNTGNESTHTHTYTSTTKQPTCAEKGLTTYTCACGDSYTEEIPATGEHTWDDGVETTAPTCAKEGVTTYTCTVCQTETKTEPIDKLPHEHSAEWSSNATYHWHECECGDKKDEAEHTPSGPATATTAQVCTVCDYVIQAETGILFNTLDVDGTKVYGKVSNTTTEFSFIDEVTVKGNATYIVDNDKDCGSPIYSKTVDLAIGDNTFYVLEMIGNDIKLFTVTLRRRPTYEVTFNTNGGTSVEKQVIEEDFLATEPETTRVGYTFSGWDYDFATPITDNTEITARWTANGDTKYIVSYYWQNIEDDNYTLHETVELKGETDTTAKAEIKEYTHFTYNASKSTITGNINPTGNRVLSVYYTRDSYKIVANNNNAKAGTATSVSGTYKFDKEITLTATTNAGYTWLGWYDGETLACETEEFTFKAEKDVTYTATWSANTDTKYTVNYYLQNLDDSNYTLHETVELKGETDTTAKAEIKEYTHFTYNASASTTSGNIDGDGILVLSVYYTRDSYSIIANNNNAKAGTATSVSGTYKFDKEFTLTATTNAGYTWLGWYDGETLACETEEFTFKAEKDVTYTATWSVNTDTKYTVNYYLQNFDDDEYTLRETVELTGTTDTTAYGETERYTHFTYNASASTISGNINGNGTLVLSVYYTRNKYTLSVNNSSAGSITNAGTYKYGVEAFTTSATINRLGYEFVGWYSGETLLSTDLTYTFTVTQNVTAKFEVKAEMSSFNFTSTTETCEITGIKETTVTEIIVPDYVTSISEGAFNSCSSLTEITLPFVGAKVGVTASHTYQYPFGYIFGTSSYTGGRATTQYYYGSSTSSTTSSTYYIPTSLKKVTITGGNILYGAFYNCSSLTSVVIPDSVTSIGAWAFNRCSSLTSVVIGNGVTSIGSSAFYYCSSLTSVVIPDSVTSIGNYAFYNCSSLTSVVIPDSVTSIGYYAFNRCSSLTSVEIGDSVTSIGEEAFYNCSSLTSVEIPDSVTSIGNSAFSYCYRLTSVVIGNSVTSIGKNAFYDCYRLTSVVIGNSVTSIGDYAFRGCSSLTSVVIPDSVTSIGKNAFYDCDGLTSVEIGDSVTSIGEEAFYNCSSLTSVEIGDSVTSIGNSAFNSCSSLTSIEIPDSVTSIGYYAFSGCSSLTSVVIPDSVTSIGGEAFRDCDSLEEITLPFVGAMKNGMSYTHFGYIFGASSYSSNDNYIPTSLKKVTITGGNILFGAFCNCSSLTSIEIPDSVTSIGNYAFSSCSSLTSIEIPDSVTSIGEEAFYDCSKLTSIEIPDSVKSIGGGAFSSCSSLTSIEIPDRVTSINYSTFSGCSSLTEIVIPDSVTSIGEEAFRGCSSLTSVEIGDSVTSIGSSAFSSCSSLTSIEIPDSVTSIGNYAFSGCRSLTSIEIPDSVTSIGNYAFNGCRSLTSVEIGDSVTSIGEWAFSYCSSLTSVEIPDSVTSIGNYAFYGCSSLTSITFKDTSTWYRTTSSSNWNNKTGGTETTVTTPSKNATYFKSTYYDYYWYKL